jgi:8-oxo-dGTP pyrophosphatase MutT (NUDIX family)
MKTTWDGLAVSDEKPFGCMVVVYQQRAEGLLLLLLHRAHRGPEYEGDWAWTPPSGARQPGEAVEDCARRELAEETGLALVPILTAHGSDDWAIYQVEAPHDTVVTLLDVEHDRYEWLLHDGVRAGRA